MRKASPIALEVLPVLVMIVLVALVANDYVLLALYAIAIFLLFLIKRIKGDIAVFVFGLIAAFLGEILFVSTGVETFTRNSLLGIMPIWLPVLWGYIFVVIKRTVRTFAL